MEFVDEKLLIKGPWNLDGSEDLMNWINSTFIKHITPKGLAIEMHIEGSYWHTSIYKVPNLNVPYWLRGRLPERYKKTGIFFPDADPFDDVVCLD